MKILSTATQMSSVKAEESIKKTAQLQQALAKLEASLSREENQKVNEKAQKT